MDKVEYKRLTVEEVKELLTTHNLTLVRRTYGFFGKDERAGCAISLLAFRHTKDVNLARNIIDDSLYGGFYGAIAAKIGIHYRYIQGLERGFEYPDLRPGAIDTEFLQGFEDGQALGTLL